MPTPIDLKLIGWTRPDLAGGWKDAHVSAITEPRGLEQPIVALVRGWIDYALHYRSTARASIGDAGAVGFAWARTGAAIRELLNGDIGRLDFATLNAILYDNLVSEGFDPNRLV